MSIHGHAELNRHINRLSSAYFATAAAKVREGAHFPIRQHLEAFPRQISDGCASLLVLNESIDEDHASSDSYYVVIIAILSL